MGIFDIFREKESNDIRIRYRGKRKLWGQCKRI